jgi:hypothetical protein
MDSLTVVAHEIGHLMGYDHDSPLEFMRDSLEAGHRTFLETNEGRWGAVTHAVDAFFQGIGSAYDPMSLNPFALDDHCRFSMQTSPNAKHPGTVTDDAGENDRQTSHWP